VEKVIEFVKKNEKCSIKGRSSIKTQEEMKRQVDFMVHMWKE